MYPARPKGLPSAFLSSCEHQCAELELVALGKALDGAYLRMQQQQEEDKAGCSQGAFDAGFQVGSARKRGEELGVGSAGKAGNNTRGSQNQKQKDADTDQVRGMSDDKAGKKKRRV